MFFQIRGGTVSDDPPCPRAQHDDPVRHRENAGQLVRDDHDRCPGLLPDIQNQPVQIGFSM